MMTISPKQMIAITEGNAITPNVTQSDLDHVAALDLQVQLDAERRNHAATRAQMLDDRGSYQREIQELRRQLQVMEMVPRL